MEFLNINCLNLNTFDILIITLSLLANKYRMYQCKVISLSYLIRIYSFFQLQLILQRHQRQSKFVFKWTEMHLHVLFLYNPGHIWQLVFQQEQNIITRNAIKIFSTTFCYYQTTLSFKQWLSPPPPLTLKMTFCLDSHFQVVHH